MSSIHSITRKESSNTFPTQESNLWKKAVVIGIVFMIVILPALGFVAASYTKQPSHNSLTSARISALSHPQCPAQNLRPTPILAISPFSPEQINRFRQLGSFDDSSFLSYKNTKSELIFERAKLYAAQARLEKDPASRAMRFHQAHQTLDNLKHLNARATKLLEKFSLGEARACRAAANRSSNPEKAIDWFIRALEVLDPEDLKNHFFIKIDTYTSCATAKKCEEASRALKGLGNNFLKISDRKFMQYEGHFASPLSSSESAANLCFQNAAQLRLETLS